jgi:hypothetical protein
LLVGGGLKPIGNVHDSCRISASFALTDLIWAADVTCAGGSTTFAGQARCLKIT